MRPRSRLAAAALAAGLVVAGCDSGARPAEEPWAGSVERWLGNAQAAVRADVPNLGAFLEQDVVVDRRGSAEGLAEGRDAALSLYRVLLQQDPEREMRQPAYLAPEGLLVLARASASRPDSGADTALLLTFGQEGLQREQSLLSVLSGRWRASLGGAGAVPENWEPLEELAERWLALWSRGDEAGVTALYADGAVVRDPLLGLHLADAPAIAAAARRPAPLQLATLPDLGGPAVFGAAPAPARAFDRAVVVLETADGRCPGAVALSLRLDAAGRITQEDRYRRLDDLRRCLPREGRPTGWWSKLPVPEPVQLTRTGTLNLSGEEVELYNAPPALAQLVEWAVGRYERAGLPPPRPASVTFHAAAPDRCGGYQGLAGGQGLTELTLCIGEARACPGGSCPPWSAVSRQLVLHELAHTWLTQNLSGEDQDRFSEAVGLRWSSRHDAWDERAMEWAASTLAWGLDEEQVDVAALGSPSAGRLREHFVQLTGVQPIAAGQGRQP